MPWRDPSNWSWLPFVLTAGQEQPKMDIQRILEQVIGAAIIGLLVMYGMVQVIGAEIESMKENFTEFKTEVRRDIQGVEKEVSTIRSDIYKPAISRGRQ